MTCNLMMNYSLNAAVLIAIFLMMAWLAVGSPLHALGSTGPPPTMSELARAGISIQGADAATSLLKRNVSQGTALFSGVTSGPSSFLLDSNSFKIICTYPVDGVYCLLPRILFYSTLLFALLLKQHEWLVAGALVSALTYSGTAAIHAMALSWTRKWYGESDVEALLAILSSSFFMLVPLLHWSENKLKHKSRTIILYWGLLIMTAVLSIYVTFPMDNGYSSWKYPLLNDTTITCTGQPDVAFLSMSGESMLTSDLLDGMGCVNPCAAVISVTLFRDPAALHPIGNLQIIPPATLRLEYLGIATIAVTLLPVMIYGILLISSGQRTSNEFRNDLFRYINRLDLSGTPFRRFRYRQTWVAKFGALLIQVGAFLMAIFCLALFILTIAVSEFILYHSMEAELPWYVDQWGAWAATGLVFVAALISKYHGQLVEYLGRRLNTHLSWKSSHLGEGLDDTERTAYHSVSKDIVVIEMTPQVTDCSIAPTFSQPQSSRSHLESNDEAIGSISHELLRPWSYVLGTVPKILEKYRDCKNFWGDPVGVSSALQRPSVTQSGPMGDEEHLVGKGSENEQQPRDVSGSMMDANNCLGLEVTITDFTQQRTAYDPGSP